MKEEIANDIKSSLSESMSSFGYEIVETLVTDVRPDRKVRDAMNDINAQKRLRVAAQDTAEAQKMLIVKVRPPFPLRRQPPTSPRLPVTATAHSHLLRSAGGGGGRGEQVPGGDGRGTAASGHRQRAA